MMEKQQQIPLIIDGISENIYAGFSVRLRSALLDLLILAPFYVLILYINRVGTNVYYFTFIPNFAFLFWFSVYLVKRYGGTPGKLISGIKILKIDGSDVDWKEAILRESITLLLSVCFITLTLIALSKIDHHYYENLNWKEKSKYIKTFAPFLFVIHKWTSLIWTTSELLVLFTNTRQRAIHDFMANTVVVKVKYLNSIREAMSIENK
ncbi:RDD family protein [Pedobacter sp. P351]|uniref:RDD family protein n=1 Tax=Pedobacter superstes TaxID=3133441 RepID=UPI0030B6021A